MNTASIQPSNTSALSNKSSKTCDQMVAAKASAKLENGDVKCPMRQLCSDEKLAVPDRLFNFSRTRWSIPSRCSRLTSYSVDRHVTASDIARYCQKSHTVIPKWFSCWISWSKAAISEIYVVIGAINPLLMAIVDLINLLLEGKLHFRFVGHYLVQHCS